jgi:putative membrane protein
MHLLALALTGLVALLHCWFMILEMFLWKKPIGLKTFAMTPEVAQTSAVLAANMGLYNGFLSAGLITSFFLPEPQSLSFRIFFLICVVVAGLYGAWSVKPKIFFIQALPALLALAFIYLSA